jgi:hypothetical protein
METIAKSLKELDHLKQQHIDLQNVIDQKIREKIVDHFEVQKLKRQKMIIKESIKSIEARLLGDLTA